MKIKSIVYKNLVLSVALVGSLYSGTCYAETLENAKIQSEDFLVEKVEKENIGIILILKGCR